MEFYLSYICCGDLGVKKAKLSRILKNSLPFEIIDYFN
jgi:hypothetical protein